MRFEMVETMVFWKKKPVRFRCIDKDEQKNNIIQEITE